MSAFIPGERCALRELRRADLDGPWAGWLNDPEVTRHMLRGVFPLTAEGNAAFFQSVATSETDLVLAIENPEREHVGNVGLHRIDWIHRTAEFGILIGDRGQWGRGIGTEATRLICAHGFRRLNLARIWLGVLAEHEAAVRAYQRVGFEIEGRLREDVERDGRRVDKLIMGLLARDLPAA